LDKTKSYYKLVIFQNFRLLTFLNFSRRLIIVPDLREGTYIVSETVTPHGYQFEETPKTVIVKSGRLTSVEFVNRPLSGI